MLVENDAVNKRRVIVWGTGHLGKGGLRMTLQHPDLELVGVHGHARDKLGRDAGELIGLPATGVKVTDDVGELLALQADCLLYFASSAFRDAEATADIVPFLEAGTNVSTISHFHLQYPRQGRPEFVEPVAAACARGGSSVLLTGEEPGFAFGQHLFALLSTTGRIDRIDLTELSYVRRYAGADSLRVYGFNEPLDHQPPMMTTDIGQAWHVNTLHGIADFIGLDVHDFTQTWETASFSEDYETAAFGMVAADRTAATRWTVTARLGGAPFLVYHKILRLHEDAAPDWQQPLLGKPGPGVTQQILITGEPNIREEMFRFGGPSATPIIAINAVPWLCTARPGILTQPEVPAHQPRNLRAVRR